MKIAFINLFAGLVVAAIGIAVSVGSYAAVSGKGGHYVVAWGAVAVGAWRAIVGLVQLLRASFTREGRAAIGLFLWPRTLFGRSTRVAFVLATAAAVYLFGPEAWTTVSPKPLFAFDARNDVKSLAYSPDGRWIVVGAGYSGLSLVDARTGEPAAKQPKLPPYSDISAATFSGNGKVLAAMSYNGLTVWTCDDWGRADPIPVVSEKKVSHGLALSPDGRLVAAGTYSEGLFVWDVQSGALKWQSGDKSGVESVAFSKDGRTIATGDNYDSVRLWDATTGQLQKALTASQPFGEYHHFTALAFLADGRIAASGYQGHDVVVWDTRSGKLLRILKSTARLGSGGSIWSIAAAPDDRWIIGGVSDGSMRFWDMKSDTPFRTIFGHRASVQSVAVSPDGLQIASGGSDHTVKIYAAP